MLSSRKYTGLTLLLPALLTGCALGSGQYSCPANVDGVRCLSTREVYEKTHRGQVPEPTLVKRGKIIQQSTPSTTDDQAPTTREATIVTDLSDSTVPIRTPAKVMRIWIAPWEETQGDLVLSGYVYTEIEARRWRVGSTPAKNLDHFTPLKAVTSNTPNQTLQEKK